MAWRSYWLPQSWLPFVPSKASLVLLFQAAKRRVTQQTAEIDALPNARIASATEELNQIADDVREAQRTPEESPPAIPASDTGETPRKANTTA
jgi:hypothetical protein